MLTERLKRLANQYLKDEWQLSKEERKEVTDNFLFFTTQWCVYDETEVILKNGGLVGKSYDYNDIVWC
jgi:hypothetical protein